MATRTRPLPLLLLSSTLALAQTEVGTKRDAIIAGRKTSDDKEVFQLIKNGNGKAFCTATRISTRTLLTAAHCLAEAKGLD